MQVRECEYVCGIVLQLILKGKAEKRNRETKQKGKSRKTRQVNRLLRKERREQN